MAKYGQNNELSGKGLKIIEIKFIFNFEKIQNSSECKLVR
jgi:hypothetical protein